MSVTIPPVPPVTPQTPDVIILEPIEERDAAGETPAAPIGTGQNVVVTTPNSTGTNPVALDITDNVSTGSVELAAATEQANIAIIGDPDADNAATVEIGLFVDSNGDTASTSGTTIQVADYYAGEVIVNYQGAFATTTKVDLDTITVGDSTAGFQDDTKGTIRDNAPGGQVFADNSFNAPDFYIQSGAANDQIFGTEYNDFIRGGAGDDLINAGKGDDIVRGGADGDTVTLGEGKDVYYFTIDQLQGNSTDVITDFVSGEDQIQINKALQPPSAPKVTFSGIGGTVLTISLTGFKNGITNVVSDGNPFLDGDVVFI